MYTGHAHALYHLILKQPYKVCEIVLFSFNKKKEMDLERLKTSHYHTAELGRIYPGSVQCYYHNYTVIWDMDLWLLLILHK